MTRRMLEIVPLAAVLSVAACLPAAAVADVLYSQPTDYPDGGFYYSQVPVAGGTPNEQVYDNILPAGVTPGTATGLSWQGGYVNPNFTSGPSLGGITGFTIGFYADNSGVPGALLQSENVSGDGGETLVGVDNFGDYIYSYGITLPTPFTLVSGTTYWLSIMADLDPAQQLWGWHTGTGGDGMAYDTILPPPSTITVDLNFTLTSVPEPSSLALVGVGGFAALAFARRRRPADH